MRRESLKQTGAEKGHSMNIGIIADSCCDLTPALRRLLQVDIVSLTIDVNGKQHVDDEHLDTKRLLAEMKAYKGAPSTACPSPEAYAAAMERYDACFVVTLSSRLSGSCNAARASDATCCWSAVPKRRCMWWIPRAHPPGRHC